MEYNVENTEFFINLTAGLEYLTFENYLLWLGRKPQFIRIQSTQFERKLLEKALQDLDNNFLMKLAIGKTCVVLDCTSRKLKGNVSRACWQGLEWIRYCLERIWFKRKIKCDMGMHVHFEREFNKLSKFTLKKLKYYRKFLKCDEVSLEYLCEPTIHDGDDEFYKKIVYKYL